MKSLPKGRRRGWHSIENSIDHGFLGLDELATGLEFGQFLNELTDLQTGKARIVRMVDLASIAKTTIDLDALTEEQPMIFERENVAPAFEEFPLLLQTSTDMPALFKMYGHYAGSDPYHVQGEEYLEYEDGCPIGVFHFDHLLDWHKPICMADVINRTIEVHQVGKLYSLDAWEQSLMQSVSFDPKQKVEIIRLNKASVTIYAEFFGECGLRVILQKERKI